MSSKATSLKAKIRNMASGKGIAAQVILQNYMFERFLERVALSAYRDNFVLKGGMLVAAMVGLDTRSTMDLDATIRAYPLDEQNLETIMREICAIKVDDDVAFQLTGVLPIRKDDEYGGFRASLKAIYDTITTPLSVDITTGDAITPGAIRYAFRGMFDEDKRIELWAYNIESVLAEKVETILRRGVFNTRARDFYDVYILSKTQEYDKAVFAKALAATARHRNTTDQIADTNAILESIERSEILQGYWQRYRQEYPYATKLSYEAVVGALRDLFPQFSSEP